MNTWNEEVEDGECWVCLQPFSWEYCPLCGGTGESGTGEEYCAECDGKGEVQMCDCYRNAVADPKYWIGEGA
jgi:hypothetical protein